MQEFDIMGYEVKVSNMFIQDVYEYYDYITICFYIDDRYFEITEAVDYNDGDIKIERIHTNEDDYITFYNFLSEYDLLLTDFNKKIFDEFEKLDYQKD